MYPAEGEAIDMPKLKLMVESALHQYLTDELTDEGVQRKHSSDIR